MNKASSLKLIAEEIHRQYHSSKSDLVMLNSSRDNLVFRIGEKRILRLSLSKNISDVKYECKLIRFLNNNKFLTPKLYKFFILEIDKINYPVIETEFIVHQNTINLDKNKISQMAKSLANLHSLTTQFLKNNKYPQKRNLTQDLCYLKNELVGTHTAVNRREVLKSVDWALDFIKKSKQSKPLVIHNDFRPNNVLFSKNGELAAIIDFDWSITSFYPEKDIAHSALEISMKDGQNVANLSKFTLFVEEYRANSAVDCDLSISNIVNWVRFSAINDAAHYFLSFPERTKKEFKSYMYDKYKYFTDLNI